MSSLNTITISSEIQSVISEQKFISDPQVEKVKQLIASKTTHDPYGNCTIDLSTVKEFSDEMHATVLSNLLPDIIASEKSQNKHILALKISPAALALKNSATKESLYETVMKLNFVFHQAHPNFAQLNNCLKATEHSLTDCTYPKHRTASLGVTGIVFNSDLTEFAAIQELDGPYKGWKAMTGTVEDKEDPINAAVREIAEETNIKVNPKNGVFVGSIRTLCFRGDNSDYNDVFAFVTDKNMHQIKTQASEIRNFQWYPVEKFLSDPAPVKHTNPLIVKGVVKAAHDALKNSAGWNSQTLHWGSGKAATFYGPNSSL